MRWLVTGAGGMLGTDVVEFLKAAGDDVVGLDRAELDVRDAAQCRRAVESADVVLNCAAWTDVDGAETDEAGAFSVNAVGAGNVARACAEHGAVMVQISTDYVFAGTADAPYPVDQPLDPLNAYGRSKAAAEWAVRAECPRSFVVRTAWLYGEHGPNFVTTMVRLSTERATIEVVDDQSGQPTWTRDLAAFLVSLAGSDAPFGTYHGTASGTTTWWGLARSVFELTGLDPDRVIAVGSDRYPRPARRPGYSVLDNGGHLPAWDDALSRALAVMVP